MNNTPRYFMSTENIKTFAQGALGAMTFGMYHMYVTNGLIENNSRHNEIAIKHCEKNSELAIRQSEKNSELAIRQSEMAIRQGERNNELAIRSRDKVIDDLVKKVENLEKRRWFW